MLDIDLVHSVNISYYNATFNREIGCKYIYIINIQIKKTGKKYSKVLTVVFLSGRVMGDYIFLC